MSVLGLERSHTAQSTAFDHSINLVDATAAPAATDGGNEDSRTSSDSEEATRVETRPTFTRQWTRSTLRKQLAQRKYAKYQREEEAAEGPPSETSPGKDPGGQSGSKLVKQGTLGTQGRLRDKVPFKSKKIQHHHHKDQNSFIDVLYQNQRGMFFCGIPLYSANSLLNFDPAEWQNAHFQDSAVDIRDAQVPDPSWQWAWRTWYVDMSHDVDEQGWEYSLNFGLNFNWHGNHPWFHSFVRRRRWLRKRVKIHSALSEKREGRSMKEAHKLNKDYFTIHAAKRDRSRDSSGDRATTHLSSAMASFRDDTDEEEDFEDITDIPSLLNAVKKARVDREKILAVSAFLKQGGEEIIYLADSMDAIMADLIHQTSRRQMQHYLQRALDEARKILDSMAGDSDEKTAEERRVQNISKVIDAAAAHIDDEDYWTESQPEKKPTSPDQPQSPLDAGPAAEGKAARDHIEASAEAKGRGEHEGGLGDEIKGISPSAEISKAPGILRPNTETEDDGGGDTFTDSGKEKGKGKEKA